MASSPCDIINASLLTRASSPLYENVSLNLPATWWDYNTPMTFNRCAGGNETPVGGGFLYGDEEPYKLFYNRAQFVTGLFCYPLVCLFGLTGNLLSIVVLSQPKMRTSTNAYLLALAISDSIKLLNDSLYFLVILMANVDKELGTRSYSYLYPYAHYLFNMSVLVTAWLTVSVAAERYIMVCHATKARSMCSVLRARVTSFIVFVIMMTLTIPLALRYRTVVTYNNVTHKTDYEVNVTSLWENTAFVTAYTWTQNMLRSVIPLTVLCALNYFIVMALRKTRTTRRRVTSRQRITVMLISVIVVFMVCITPDAVITLCFDSGYHEASYLVKGIREITDLLLAINSACNFVLYCTFSKIFRKNFVLLFPWKTCQEKCSPPINQSLNGHHNSSFTTYRGTALVGTKAAPGSPSRRSPGEGGGRDGSASRSPAPENGELEKEETDVFV